MRKRYILRVFSLLVLAAVVLSGATTSFAAGPKCSGCHPSMAKEPMQLPETPPADLLLAMTTPCFNYAKVLEDYYYVEELFVTIEHHLADLEEDRYHVEPLYENLVSSRDYYREVKKQPVISLDEFILKTGKLRFELGKVYRLAKEKRIDQMNRNIFGVFVLATLFILYLIIAGWRTASGSGVVHPPKTKLGFDDLQEQGLEAVLDQEAKEKETTE